MNKNIDKGLKLCMAIIIGEVIFIIIQISMVIYSLVHQQPGVSNFVGSIVSEIIMLYVVFYLKNLGERSIYIDSRMDFLDRDLKAKMDELSGKIESFNEKVDNN